jgi:predicted Zn-dependent protease
MSSASNKTPPQWLSTHPSGTDRITEIERHLDRVMPLYAKSIGVSLDQLLLSPPITN